MKVLDVELRRQYGTRKWGGRRPDEPKTAAELLCDLEKRCWSWLGWTTPLAGKDSMEPPLKEVPADLLKLFLSVTKAIKRLHKALDDHLSEGNPTRQRRLQPEVNETSNQQAGEPKSGSVSSKKAVPKTKKRTRHG